MANYGKPKKPYIMKLFYFDRFGVLKTVPADSPEADRQLQDRFDFCVGVSMRKHNLADDIEFTHNLLLESGRLR